jgi:Winged helix-turn helix
LVGWVRERFGISCCRETIRAALHRLELSWKKAKKLLGRADPARRQAFIARVQDLLAGAQRARHLLVYLDEAHVHQDVDLGYGWAARGQRFWVASSSPGLSAKLSFYGLYLYNEGQGQRRTGATKDRGGSGRIREPMASTPSTSSDGSGPNGRIAR